MPNCRGCTMVPFKAAIFDLDGTLIDSTGIWAQIDVDFLAKRGLEVPEDYIQSISDKSFLQTAEYTIQRFGFSDTPQELMEEWHQMAIDAYRSKIGLKPYAREYLLALRDRGIPLAIATASSPELYEPVLEHNGIRSLFSAIVTTDQVQRGKGFPDVFLLAAHKLGVSPKDCIAFEDILPGIRGILAAGMTAYGIYDPYSAHQRQEIQALAKDYFLDFSIPLAFEQTRMETEKAPSPK